MFEESVEGFIARWRRHACEGVAFARSEGSPLLEVAVGSAVLQVFERTGPYLAPAGPVRLILHAVAGSWSTADAGEGSFAPAGLARLRLSGRVVEREEALVVVDAGVPLVLGLDPAADGGGRGSDDDAGVAPWPVVGDWVSCETLAPTHGFVLPADGPRRPGVPSDEQV